MSNGSDPQETNRTMLGSVVRILFSLGTIVTALGTIVPAVTTAVVLVFGGGSPALEGAIRNERAAENVLADAQERCAVKAAAVICKDDTEHYDTEFSKNNLEDAIASGFEAGTLIALVKWTENVASLEDLPSWTMARLENELTPNIRAAIRDNTGENVETVAGALNDCGCFGSAHSYARLVEDLANKHVTRKALEGAPHLVEKPKWWRDWLLGGGLAVGGSMVGGVIGAVLWPRTRRRQASED